ncbi:MAG: hypothetical protein LBD01_07235, partial [Puniceicoccales bacterium]|nr:hypothetical protein [Puniceicoccales bacterium]
LASNPLASWFPRRKRLSANDGAEGKIAECRAVHQPGPIEAPASEAWNEITDKAGHPRLGGWDEYNSNSYISGLLDWL